MEKIITGLDERAVSIIQSYGIRQNDLYQGSLILDDITRNWLEEVRANLKADLSGPLKDEDREILSYDLEVINKVLDQ